MIFYISVYQAVRLLPFNLHFGPSFFQSHLAPLPLPYDFDIAAKKAHEGRRALCFADTYVRFLTWEGRSYTHTREADSASLLDGKRTQEGKSAHLSPSVHQSISPSVIRLCFHTFTAQSQAPRIANWCSPLACVYYRTSRLSRPRCQQKGKVGELRPPFSSPCPNNFHIGSLTSCYHITSTVGKNREGKNSETSRRKYKETKKIRQHGRRHSI